MADYITREAAEQAKCEFLNENGEYAKGWNDCNREYRKNILEIPAANVRPVVLCKDCRHRDPEDHKCDCGQLERAGCVFPVDDNYWCAHGEKGETNAKD